MNIEQEILNLKKEVAKLNKRIEELESRNNTAAETDSPAPSGLSIIRS